jgi:hypothetical protein
MEIWFKVRVRLVAFACLERVVEPPGKRFSTGYKGSGSPFFDLRLDEKGCAGPVQGRVEAPGVIRAGPVPASKRPATPPIAWASALWGCFRGQIGHNWAWRMSGEIDAGACLTQVPHDLACRDHEGGDQAAGAVADVFVFAFLGFARLGRNRGILALEDLHAGLFVAADDQLAMLIQDGSLHVESANILSLGVEVGIVTVEPVDAAMWFQVSLVQDAPDGGAMHGFVGMPVD